jgi:acyl carrier protein
MGYSNTDERADSAEAVAQRVAAILGAALGRGPLAADDDFFAAGGDSLAAIEAAAAIEEELGFELSIEDVFTASGVAELSDLVWQGLRAGS